MAQTISIWTDLSQEDVCKGTYDLETATLKAILLTTSWAPTDDSAAKNTEYVTTIATYEPSISGYTGGFAGAGRKKLNETAHDFGRLNDGDKWRVRGRQRFRASLIRSTRLFLLRLLPVLLVFLDEFRLGLARHFFVVAEGLLVDTTAAGQGPQRARIAIQFLRRHMSFD